MINYRFVCAVVSLALWAGMAQAQNVGAISGKVTDTSEAVVPGATIEIKNLDTGVTRTVTASAQGEYRAPELPLGAYQVEASFAGFKKVMRSGIQLTSGRDATVNFQLTVGEVQEIVTVNGDAPLVETTKADMGALVSREQISDLPLHNRDFSQLITLQAGTTQYRFAGASATAGYGARISVSGARPTSNSFTLDGADVNNANQLIPSGVDGSMLGVEAIREFKVLSSNYSAQYGRASGANLIAVSRSGTNQLHGSLFEYFRNDKLDAKSWTSNTFGTAKGALRRNQFGGSLGGPVKKDKLFYFGTYEGGRQHQPRTRVSQVPTTAARTGLVSSATSGCLATPIAVVDAVKPYIALWPKATGPEGACSLTADYVVSDVKPTTNDYLSARVDDQLGSNHSLFGRYTFDNSNFTDPNAIPLFGTKDRIRNQYITLEERSILSPVRINAVRLGFSRSAQFEDLYDIAPPPAALSFVTGRPIGGINVGSGITSLSGYDSSSPRHYILNILQAYDDLTWERGSHSLKIGAQWERFNFNRTAVSRLGGAFQFSNWQGFLTNAAPRRLRIQGPDQFSCGTYGTCYSDPFRSLFQHLFGAYVQDDWRVNSRLMLNLGVRYEMTSTPTEKWGRLANLRHLTDATETVGEPLYQNPTKDNFSPRFGFAWDPTGSGKTSIRGGTGLFYEAVLARQFLNSIDRNPPFWSDVDPALSNAQCNAATVLARTSLCLFPGLFPNVTPYLAALASGPAAIHSVDFNMKTPYTIQSSLAIQRMITPSTVVEVGYTWTHGIHLSSRADMAIPRPTLQADGRWYFADPTNNNVSLLINPAFTRLEWYSTGTYSNYHGLRASFNHNMAQGLHLQVNYTWSKAMDTLSSHVSGELGDSSVQNGFSIPADYALADFHVGQNFVTNFSYELPLGKGKKIGASLSGVTGSIVGGWQVSGVFSAQSGSPLSASSDPTLTHVWNRQNARPDLKAGANNNPQYGGTDHQVDVTGNPIAGFLWFDPKAFVPQSGGTTAAPSGYLGNLGRNTIIGPGAISMDFSILKNTPLGENRSLQFRAEFFNLFNTPQFSQPTGTIFSGNAFSANAGRIQSTIQDSERQVQLALRFTF
jgi:carboxypeptidase family protein/TonB-dependent receptor-like protein